MQHPPDPDPQALENDPLQAVLDWLDAHAHAFSRSDPEGVHGLVTSMLGELRRAARHGELHFAWSPHGLEDDQVGPVIVLLSPQGAALASVSRRGKA